MRRTIVFLALLGTMVAQIVAQQPQALYFHYKNGESFACEPSDISFITYDKSGASDEYDIQVIYFNDGTYQEIDFANVDSVGFNAPVPKLNEGALVLDKKFEDYIIKGDTVSFTMRLDTPADLRPKVGNVVGSTWDNTVFEHGIMARVTDITETAEGYVYTCEKADIDDFYEEFMYYGYGDIYQEPESEQEPAPRRAMGDLTLKNDITLWHHKINVTPPTLTLDDYTVGLGLQAETEGRAKMYLNKPKGGKLFVRFNFSTDFDASLSASITGRNGSSTVKPILAYPLGIIATPIPILFFKPELQLNWYYDAFAEMKGAFKASMDYEGEVQVTLENGEWSAKTLKNNFDAGVDEFSLSINGWYGVGVEPKLFLSLSGTKTGVAVASRIGAQLTGNLKMDFSDYLADGSLYESLKDSKLALTIPTKGILTAELGLFSKTVKSVSLTFMTTNAPLYEGYMLPDFGYAAADDLGGGRYRASASLWPRDLLPWESMKLGFAAFDDDNRLVEKQYVANYSNTNKPSSITTEFSLPSGKDYTIAPILNIFGHDLRADRTTPVVPGEAVDLGLSVKWSSTNVGAEHIYERGYAYQWGMTIPSHLYDTSMHYVFGAGDTAPSCISGNSTYDPSTQWGKGWAMPTIEQWEELLEKCTIEGVEAIPRPDYLYPIAGVKVTGPNGNHIYIPANVGLWSGTAGNTSGLTYTGTYVGFLFKNGQVTIQKGGGIHEKTYLIRPVCSGD